jgi:hypothetical protein
MRSGGFRSEYLSTETGTRIEVLLLATHKPLQLRLSICTSCISETFRFFEELSQAKTKTQIIKVRIIRFIFLLLSPTFGL